MSGGCSGAGSAPVEAIPSTASAEPSAGAGAESLRFAAGSDWPASEPVESLDAPVSSPAHSAGARRVLSRSHTHHIGHSGSSGQQSGHAHPKAKPKKMAWQTLKNQMILNRVANHVGARAGETSSPGQFKQIVEQLARLNNNVEVLSSAMRAQRTVCAEPALSDMHQAYLEYSIDYTDKRPLVEVSVEILEISDFQLATGEFVASFNVRLDWEEPDFLEGVHYYQDQRSKMFVISSWLLEDPNSFNPRICIANEAENLKGEENPDRPFEPRIHRLVTRGTGAAARDSVWLTKLYSFSGCLKCAHVDGAQFPWDMQRLPVQVKSLPMDGQTTLGQPRKIQLVEPRLRKMEALESVRRRRRLDTATVLRIDDYSRDPALAGIEAHRWSMVDKTALGSDVAVPNFVVGEMKVCAFGGSDPVPDQYHIEIVLVRNWKQYFFDFQIQMLLVAVSLCTAWVPLNVDSVANRLSISMTIVLAIVFFATTKPPAIAELTYATMHDFWDQCMLFISTAGCVENVFVYVQCYGMDRSNVEEWVLGVGSLLPHHWCQEGVVGSAMVDQWFSFGMLSVMVGIFLYMLINAQIYRIRFLARVRRELGSCDMDVYDNIGWETEAADASKLVTSDSQSLLQAGRTAVGDRLMFHAGVATHFALPIFRSAHNANAEIVYCIARHGMPMLWIFPRFWVFCALRGCQCRKKYTAPITDLSDKLGVSNVLNMVPLTQSKTVADRDSQQQEEPPSAEWMEEFVGVRPTLPRQEPARIIDCGTGEVGFYEYRWRQPLGSDEEENPMLYLDKSEKMKIGANKTFMEDFVLPVDGPDRFAQQLVDNYFSDIQDEMGSRPSSSQLGSSSGASQRQAKKPKILFGPTGQNRVSLMKSAQSAREMEKWVQRVEDLLNERLAFTHPGTIVDVLLFIPTEQDEATYELVATEFLVQRCDLSVSDVQQGVNNVPFAGVELNQALMRAGQPRANRGSGTVFSLSEFVREFSDLMDSEIDRVFMEAKFEQAALSSASSPGGNFADSSAISEVIRASPQLMRALVKTRLFNGTLSAGGGSCQITVKPDHEERIQNSNSRRASISQGQSQKQVMRTSEFHSVKLGNKSPSTTGTLGYAMWPSSEPMSQNLIDLWRGHINTVLDGMDFPPKLQGNLRGVYIGISSVFYAASAAGCAEALLPKAVFLGCLDGKLQEMLAKPPKPAEKNGEMVYNHLTFSNLVLVHEVVKRVLAETAWIVCKRKWKAQPASLEKMDGSPNGGQSVWGGEEPLPEYVATWSLGFFLSQA